MTSSVSSSAAAAAAASTLALVPAPALQVVSEEELEYQAALLLSVDSKLSSDQAREQALKIAKGAQSKEEFMDEDEHSSSQGRGSLKFSSSSSSSSSRSQPAQNNYAAYDIQAGVANLPFNRVYEAYLIQPHPNSFRLENIIALVQVVACKIIAASKKWLSNTPSTVDEALHAYPAALATMGVTSRLGMLDCIQNFSRSHYQERIKMTEAGLLHSFCKLSCPLTGKFWISEMNPNEKKVLLVEVNQMIQKVIKKINEQHAASAVVTFAQTGQMKPAPAKAKNPLTLSRAAVPVRVYAKDENRSSALITASSSSFSSAARPQDPLLMRAAEIESAVVEFLETERVLMKSVKSFAEAHIEENGYGYVKCTPEKILFQIREAIDFELEAMCHFYFDLMILDRENVRLHSKHLLQTLACWIEARASGIGRPVIQDVRKLFEKVRLVFKIRLAKYSTDQIDHLRAGIQTVLQGDFSLTAEQCVCIFRKEIPPHFSVTSMDSLQRLIHRRIVVLAQELGVVLFQDTQSIALDSTVDGQSIFNQFMAQFQEIDEGELQAYYACLLIITIARKTAIHAIKEINAHQIVPIDELPLEYAKQLFSIEVKKILLAIQIAIGQPENKEKALALKKALIFVVTEWLQGIDTFAKYCQKRIYGPFEYKLGFQRQNYVKQLCMWQANEFVKALKDAFSNSTFVGSASAPAAVVKK